MNNNKNIYTFISVIKKIEPLLALDTPTSSQYKPEPKEDDRGR